MNVWPTLTEFGCVWQPLGRKSQLELGKRPFIPPNWGLCSPKNEDFNIKHLVVVWEGITRGDCREELVLVAMITMLL